MIEIFLLTFTTLFVIIDPIGLAPITVALLKDFEGQRRRRIIFGAVTIAFCLLLIFGLIGEAFLSKIGIGMPAFQISGGILLFLTALEILFEKRNARRQSSTDEHFEPAQDPMVFPLAMPLMAGPGAMTAMILLTNRYEGDWGAQLIVYLTMAFVLCLTAALALAANRFAHVLGETGLNLLNRLLGMLLAALSVQFVVDGVSQIVKGIV